MIESILQKELDPVFERQRKLRWRWQLGGVLALAWLAGLLGLYLSGGLFVVRAGAVIFGLLAAGWIWFRNRSNRPDYREMARAIEARHPEMRELLLTAVEQKPEQATGQLNFLQRRVIYEAVSTSDQMHWAKEVSDHDLSMARSAGICAAILLLLTAVAYPRRPLAQTVLGKVPWVARQSITVTPGDVVMEKGNPLVVLARFEGPLPHDATLVATGPGGVAASQGLSKNLNDPVFGGSLPEVKEDLIYRVDYGGRRTRDFKVRVFEFPRLEKADATLRFPDYTALAEKRIADTRRVTGVEGTRVDLELQLNKMVRSARLVGKKTGAMDLKVETNAALASLKNFELRESDSYVLHLVDAEGRTNRIPAQFVFESLKNRLPELKFVSPRGDQRVSALQELELKAEAWDDFGLLGYGFSYTIPGEKQEVIALGATNLVKARKEFRHLLRLEDLKVKPDQLVSYVIWADDVGPDGKTRRTYSDMFFAEVRPFEEIYRQGQSMSGESQGGQQQGSPATKLAELQKQIINATWKLQRQEKADPPSAQYLQDIPAVRDSQVQARGEADRLKSKASDPRMQGLIEIVRGEMEKAVKRLAAATQTTVPLPEAVAAEQAAYQALLKIQSREYEISQNRSRSQGQGGQRNQKQMDQLELKMTENRYENQKQAAPAASGQQKEQLEILNRLKELAQRQQDLNERLKELQTALQEAKSEQEREEIRRRLKRLREEEREMLAEVDETRQRMDRAQDQSQVAQARQDLERTRSEIQRASEALEKGSVSQALSEGSRAQEDLTKLRDDFRKRSSSQFAQEMREMRSETREMAQREEEISKKFDDLEKSTRKTLSQGDEKKEIAAALEEQKKRLTNLVSRATELTERAEVPEPLLAKQLYDTVRKASQDDAAALKQLTSELAQSRRLTRSVYDTLERGKEQEKKAVEVSAELLKNGSINEARQLESRARAGLESFKQGVEKAAESVLGDEREALAMADKELEDLMRQLGNELAANATNSVENPGAPGEKSSAESPGKSESGRADPKSRAEAPDRDGKSAQGEKSGSAGKGEQGGKGERQAAASGQNGSQGEGGQSGRASRQRGSEQARNGGGNRANQRAGEGGGDGGGGGGNWGGLEPWLDRGGDVRRAEGPLLGNNFSEWSERLANVQELVDDPKLQNEISRARERARVIRTDFKRNLKKPDWAVVRAQILQPLAEVRGRVGEAMAQRQNNAAVVPIDRDPVPAKYSELVRKYYENLGKE